MTLVVALVGPLGPLRPGEPFLCVLAPYVGYLQWALNPNKSKKAVLQNEDNSNDPEAKPLEAAKEYENKKIVDPALENIGIINEKCTSDKTKQSVAEKVDLIEAGEKSVSKAVKKSVSWKGDSAKDEVVDKNLLLAFRYFDQNRAGFLKDLVQIALVKSNSARDNCIFLYKACEKS